MIARQNTLFSLVVIVFVLAVLAAPILPIALGSKTAQADVAGWSKHTIDSDFQGAQRIYAIDVDRDGDMDILGAASYDDEVAWWENDGNENFTKHIIDAPIDSDAVYAIDIDGDADIDVLMASDDNAQVNWYENDGSQNFAKHNIDSDFLGGHSVYAADIKGDGDNHLDVLASANNINDIAWYENDGSENFTKHIVDGDFGGAGPAYAADVDGDGDMDILGAAFTDDDIAWYENDGSENFTKHIIDGAFDGASYVYATDVDGDSDVDVLGVARKADDIAWWENDGSENFTKHIIDGAFDGASSVYVDDVDGDGDMDVLGSAIYAGDIAWWENDGSENFTKRIIDADFMADGTTGADDVYAEDIDGDGDVDVLGASFGWLSGQVAWWENLHHTGAWTKRYIDTGLDGAVGLYVHDIDGDGNPDIVAAGYDAAAIVWYEAPDNPDGPWIRHNIDTNFTTGDVYVHDIDGDGNPDVATASYWDGDVVWYEAPDDPTGSWLKHYIDTSLTYARSPVQVHDMDGDGNPDVVATAESGDNVVWYEAPDDPTGTWTRHTIDSNNNGARQLDVYDIDNDSNPDVVVTSYGSDELVWYEAPDDPTQVWVRHVIDNTGDTAGYLHIHDIDMDGNADVVTTIELAGNQLVWYESPDDPTGAWAKHEIDSSLTGAYRVYVGDIDGDGDPDTAAKDDNKVFWYEAPDVPSGAWTKHEIDSSLVGGGDVHVFDIDLDGNLDMAATGSVADDVVWYENLGAPGPSDTTPPDTEITSGPSGTIEVIPASFFFSWIGADDVTLPSELLYSYYLEGYDNAWSSWTSDTTSNSYDLYQVPDGDYVFRVRAKDQGGNVDPTPAERAFSVIDYEWRLANRFKPILYLAPGEKFEPEPIEIMLNPNVKLRDRNNAGFQADATLENLQAHNGPNYYLDLEPNLSSLVASWIPLWPFSQGDWVSEYETQYELIQEDYNPTVYARVAEEEGYLVVQYWIFYYYNDAPGPDSTIYTLDHESEWEMVELVFDTDDLQGTLADKIKQVYGSSDSGMDPWFAAYAQHLSGDARLWDDMKPHKNREGYRPIVYVALGSHASYFESGRQFTKNALFFDYTGRGTRIDDDHLHFELLTRDSEEVLPWLSFEGLWGEVGAMILTPGWLEYHHAAGPKGPAFHRGEWPKWGQWDHPYEWGNWHLSLFDKAKSKLSEFVALLRHESAELHVYDFAGRHVGPNGQGGIDLEIPGAQFIIGADGHAEAIVIPSTDIWGQYTVEVRGDDSGNATLALLIPNLSLGTQYYVTYGPVEVQVGTVGQVVVNPETNFNLSLDSDGDGVFDAEVPPTYSDSVAIEPQNLPPAVEAGADQIADEGEFVALEPAIFADAAADTHNATIDWGDGAVEAGQVVEADGLGTVSGSHSYADDNAYTVTVTIADDKGAMGNDTFTVLVNNVAPGVGAITAPVNPMPAGISISATADFSDPGILDTHTGEWDWGDGEASPGDVTEINGSGNVTGSHTYDTPGIYTVTLTVEDDDGGVGSAEYQYVVVYDPGGGFVTGGGWIYSEAGAYVPDGSLECKATFGFVSKYKRGATTPTGQTEFKVADLNFHSDSYDWLVIAGPKAIYKGTGTINGEGNYGFMLSAIDEKLTPSADADLFRVKIWDKDDDDAIVYDNQMGDGDDADPATEISGGSIVIHKQK